MAHASPRQLLLAYYGATLVFLLLDVVFGVNIRIAFLDGSAVLRAGYYGICFACLALMLWQPAWTAVIGAFESLVTLVALIIGFGMRAILVSDAVLEGRAPFITLSEVANFAMSGGIAYLAWVRGMQHFRDRLG